MIIGGGNVVVWSWINVAVCASWCSSALWMTILWWLELNIHIHSRQPWACTVVVSELLRFKLHMLTWVNPSHHNLCQLPGLLCTPIFHVISQYFVPWCNYYAIITVGRLQHSAVDVLKYVLSMQAWNICTYVYFACSGCLVQLGLLWSKLTCYMHIICVVRPEWMSNFYHTSVWSPLVKYIKYSLIIVMQLYVSKTSLGLGWGKRAWLLSKDEGQGIGCSISQLVRPPFDTIACCRHGYQSSLNFYGR